MGTRHLLVRHARGDRFLSELQRGHGESIVLQDPPGCRESSDLTKRTRYLGLYGSARYPGALRELIATLRPASAATRYDAGARIAGLSLTERCSSEPWPGLAVSRVCGQRRRRGDPCQGRGSDS